MIEIYDIEPCGLLFSKNGKVTSLNGEDYSLEGRRTEFLCKVKEAPPFTEAELITRTNKALFNRDYAIDLVRYEIIEKAEKRKKKVKQKPKGEKKK